MRVIRFVFCFILIFALQSVSAPMFGVTKKKVAFVVDTKKSKIRWVGKKLTDQHNGTIKIKKGEIKKNDGSFKGFIVIDMSSIACKDIKDPKYNKKLVNHLKSEDFFYIKKYETAKLEITDVKKISKNKHTVYGAITIRGKTQKIDFPARIVFSKKSFKAKGKLTIDRTKFGIRYGSGSFFKSLGDKIIYDDFTLKFEVYSK